MLLDFAHEAYLPIYNDPPQDPPPDQNDGDKSPESKSAQQKKPA